MLECIQTIGSIIESNSKDSLEKIIDTLQKPRKGKDGIIVKINFNTVDGLVEMVGTSVSKDYDYRKLALDYAWVGNSKANSEQWALTTNKLRYILRDSIMNLAKKTDKNGELYQKLNNVVKVFYHTDGTKVIGKDAPCLLDLTKLKDYDSTAANVENSAHKVEAEIIKKMTHPKEQVILWTVTYNGELLSQCDEYKHLLIKQKTESADDKESFQGICSYCGRNTLVSFDSTKKMRFKYFITDKISFASDLSSNGYKRNMAICKDCLRRHLFAEKFIDQRLRSRLGDYQTYVIPCLVGSEMKDEELQYVASSALDNFSSIVNMNNIVDLEQSLEEVSRDGDKSQYLLTLMFENPSATATSSKFKIAKVLYEVPESRFRTLKKQLITAAKEINESFNPNKRVDMSAVDPLKFGLSDLYEFTKPLARSSKKAITKKITKKVSLEIVSSVIINGTSDDPRLISRFVEHLRSLYSSEQFHFAIFSKTTLQMNIFMAFLKLTTAREMGENEKMKESNREIMWSEKNKEFFDSANLFIKAAGYTDLQTGLFYVGILCGNLGNAQYRKLKSSPILDRISFRGMDKDSFVRFYNGLMEALKHYDLFPIPDIQSMAYLSHLNLDKYLAMDNWGGKIREEEVPFYMLSGMSFHYYTRRMNKEKNQEEDDIDGE
ncbi:MAG: hypothetical protein B2I17_06030 [Thermoplasmatales archaeon B_DKE]|nr:MAG: hypothetical protein B2I17_06030 [Thermoplasmatales archaeon B_DKE]